MSKEISDDKLDDILRRAVRKYIENWSGNPNPAEENMASATIEYKMSNDTNFGSVVMAYSSLRRQELDSKEQAKLQKWLIVFSGIAVIVPIAVGIIAKFA